MTSTDTTVTPANHMQCAAGDGAVRRGDAVIRSSGLRQIGWHRDCYTVHRATKDVDVAKVEGEAIGGPLTKRLARAGYR